MSDGAKSKIERLILLSERVTEALAEDVKALEAGDTGNLRSIDAPFQQLMLNYSKEAQGVNAAVLKHVAPDLRDKLTRAARTMNESLTRHQRLVTRVRNASEGLIQAVAREVERRQTSQRSYGRTPAQRTQPSGAMVYNSVI